MLQLAEAPAPLSVQLAEGVKEPEELLKLMLPDGNNGIPVSLSVALAVQVVG